MPRYAGIFTAAASGGGGTAGTRPAFGAAGTAYENTTLGTTHTPVYPATVGTGEIAVAVLWARSTSVSTSLSLHANASNAGWSTIASPVGSADGAEELLVAWRVCSGAEDGSAMEGGITGSGNETESHVHGCIFTLTAADGFASSPMEDVTSATETGTTVGGPTIVPAGINRLAVSIIGFSDDNLTASAFTGASVTWTERINIATALQTDSTIQIQTAPADATISGGSFTAALDTVRLRFAFAVAPASI